MYLGMCRCMRIRCSRSFLQHYGQVCAGLTATLRTLERMGRLFWFTVEFGVIRDQDGEVKVYGSGLISSHGECTHVLEQGAGVEIREVPSWTRCSTSRWMNVSEMQPVLYAIESFEQLYEATREAEARLGVRLCVYELRSFLIHQLPAALAAEIQFRVGLSHCVRHRMMACCRCPRAWRTARVLLLDDEYVLSIATTHAHELIRVGFSFWVRIRSLHWLRRHSLQAAPAVKETKAQKVERLKAREEPVGSLGGSAASLRAQGRGMPCCRSGRGPTSSGGGVYTQGDGLSA